MTANPMTTKTAMTAPAELPPHHEVARNAILGALPQEPTVSQGALAELAADLERRLSAAVGPAPSASVRVERTALAEAMACPASSRRPAFLWHAPLAARRLGLVALGQMCRTRRGGLSALEATREALEAEMDLGTRLGTWLKTLGPAETGSVLAAASSWAARQFVAVPWRALGKVAFGPRPLRATPTGSTGPVVLESRLDADVVLGAAPSVERVLVVLGRPRRATVAFDALVASLSLSRAPLRVVTVDPASGRVEPVGVDQSLLARAADQIVEVARALAPIARGQELAQVPGPACYRCRWRRECNPGAGWLAARARRVAGVPLGTPVPGPQ